jgi:toxin ParE1/3/4
LKLVTMHSDAEADLREALDYYKTQRIGLSGEFRREFKAALKRVRENPLLFAPEDDSGIRQCALHRFPYNVVFVDFDERIWVAAVAHQHRRPRFWARRRPD